MVAVLGAPVLAGGRPSPALQERLAHAAAMYRHDPATVICVSGGDQHDGWNRALTMRRLLVDSAVPEQAIILECNGTDLFDSATRVIALGLIAQASGFVDPIEQWSVVLGLDELHAASWAFAQIGGMGRPAPVFFVVPTWAAESGPGGQPCLYLSLSQGQALGASGPSQPPGDEAGPRVNAAEGCARLQPAEGLQLAPVCLTDPR